MSNPSRIRRFKQLNQVFCCCLLAVSFCGAGISAQAQSSAFTYQGRLAENGAPANGLHDLRFILFDALIGGAQQGAILTLEDVPVTAGNFSVLLDFGAAAFPGAERWLEIAVRPGASMGLFTVLSPRQPVRATPYAIRSLSAANADTAATATNATNAAAAVNFSGALGGDVTGNQGATTVGRLRNIPLPAPVQADHKSVLRYENDGVIPARFVLSPDENSGGTITGVTVSTGLNGGGTSGTVNIAIGPGGVSTEQLADNGVTTAKLADSNVTTAKLADGSVTTAKLANGGVTKDKLEDGSVIDAKIATVAGNKITGTIPVAAVPAGNGSYVQNTTTTQAVSNFNISGNGTAGGTLSGSAVNAMTQYNLGGSRVLSTAGTNNLFVGIGAGAVNNGLSNSFFGYLAGESNTTGDDNSFFGSFAGNDNTTGHFNSFFGNAAGENNTTGQFNSFFGRAAGTFNTTGSSNSFFGRTAGFSNITGNDNAFFGDSAGQANTHGEDNSFFGSGAGQANIIGNDNSFFGEQAGAANTFGSLNSFFGSGAGASNTEGFGNSFFGRSAGSSNTTGIQNSFFGETAGQLTTGGGNSFFGYATGTFNTSGPANSFFGNQAGNTNTTGSRNTLIGNHADVGVSNLTYATAIGADAIATSNARIQLGRDGLDTVRIGVLSAATATHVCISSNNVLSSCSSSQRYKQNVHPWRSGLKLIQRLRPVTFDWKEQQQHDLGLIAEEVAKVEPLLVTYNKAGVIEGVKYDQLSIVLINAVKEQQEQIKAQQRLIEAQQQKLAQQAQSLEAIKRLVCAQNQTAAFCRP